MTGATPRMARSPAVSPVATAVVYTQTVSTVATTVIVTLVHVLKLMT